jgi:hypothetical protein
VSTDNRPMSHYAPFVPSDGTAAGPPLEAPATSDDLVMRDGFAIVFGPGGGAWIDRPEGPRQDITPDAHALTAELFGAPDESYDSVN